MQANIFVGAKHDLRQYGMITNNLSAVMLLQASKVRCTQENTAIKLDVRGEDELLSNCQAPSNRCKNRLRSKFWEVFLMAHNSAIHCNNIMLLWFRASQTNSPELGASGFCICSASPSRVQQSFVKHASSRQHCKKNAFCESEMLPQNCMGCVFPSVTGTGKQYSRTPGLYGKRYHRLDRSLP
jgi:hypothetical protein